MCRGALQHHRAAVIQAWSDAEHQRMQVMTTIKRYQEQTTQDRLTRENVLTLTAELKVRA